MKRKLFNFASGKTQIVHLLEDRTPELILQEALKGVEDRADGICIQLGKLERPYRTVDNYRNMVDAISIPVLFNCYRNDIDPEGNDDTRAQVLLDAAQAGAAMVDVMGDQFAPSPEEHTTDAAALQRQKTLINDLHQLGTQVELSSHTSCFLPADEILHRLQEFEERGADLVKLVTTANTVEEYLESLRGTLLAKEKLHKPFIHLCGGAYGRLHRINGILSGINMTFAVHEESATFNIQPFINDGLELEAIMKRYHLNPWS